MQKKVLLLGGTSSLVPMIKKAHELGIYTITCDYIPNNSAHQYSDEYHNISVIDKEACLSLAEELKIDGIISFACDAGITTAAYIQEKMGLPSIGPYESVCILQNKDSFRSFLRQNGFNVPKSYSFNSISEANKEKVNFVYPIIVKPTDSNGSKGVSKVENENCLEHALHKAFSFSKIKRIIIEEYIEPIGDPSDSDCFTVNGELTFISFSNQIFDSAAENPFAPAAFSWPSSIETHKQDLLQSDLQKLLNLLHMKTSIYNVETRIGNNGKQYLMEVSPRGGGNRIAEMLYRITGVDLIENNLRAALDLPLISFNCSNNTSDNWAEVILHSNKEGIFRGIKIKSSRAQKYLVEKQILVKEGDYISQFSAGDKFIGTLIFNFRNNKDLAEIIKRPNDLYEVFLN